MHLGGKTRSKHDHIPSHLRREHGTKGRKMFKAREPLEGEEEIPILDLIDNTPDIRDLIVFGPFGQRVQFSY